MTTPLPWTSGPDGVRLAVRLTPRASRTGLDGLVIGADGRSAVQLRVAAPPVEGAANAALVAYLADALDLRRRDIRIVSGETARQKLVALAGDSADLTTRLDRWIAAAPPRR
ncbi:hypothetical protein PMNALOAF_3321 [Methylobacterium adhaesivum]|uniref:UPF0235 protein QWZ12_14025 n=1 Tax=Methylobacterium adhaesivum TaxID=333297 RepID=A0ABT8BIJ8_9HYPH|nr:DUF167 domain-containing protein [Methylobacterium adhaesivum]MDN3591718.1 DUF167 domain-containing protein [Methylobacterium adhaesivum]GJD32056.1 hypothetical protein PMNALOAF_3321 [Methylobacterium adhaesivum]